MERAFWLIGEAGGSAGRGLRKEAFALSAAGRYAPNSTHAGRRAVDAGSIRFSASCGPSGQALGESA